MDKKIVLASASPRRKALLAMTGWDFDVLPVDVAETILPGTKPKDAVLTLALRKGKAAALLRPEAMVVGADTIVSLGDRIYGKPKTETDAMDMLKSLSGKTHQVYTGVALVCGGESHSFAVSTDVTFYPLSDREIADYIATGEPMDKAGAYGIQGYGGLLVEKINGCYNNVVGLPVAALIREMQVFEAKFSQDSPCQSF